jgi:hypothetical protein
MIEAKLENARISWQWDMGLAAVVTFWPCLRLLFQHHQKAGALLVHQPPQRPSRRRRRVGAPPPRFKHSINPESTPLHFLSTPHRLSALDDFGSLSWCYRCPLLLISTPLITLDRLFLAAAPTHIPPTLFFFSKPLDTCEIGQTTAQKAAFD